MSAMTTATAVQPNLDRTLAVTSTSHTEAASGGVEHAIDVLILQTAAGSNRADLFGPLYEDFLPNIQAIHDVQIVHTVEDTLEYLSFSPTPRAVLVLDGTNWVRADRDLCWALRELSFNGGTVLLCQHFKTLNSWEYQNYCFRSYFGIPWTHGEYTRSIRSLWTMKPLFGNDLSQTLKRPNHWERIYVLGAAAETDIYLVDGKMPPRPGPPEPNPGWMFRGPDCGKKSKFYPNKYAAQIKFDSLHHPAVFGRLGRGYIGYVGELNKEAGVEALVMKMLEYGLGSPPKPNIAGSYNKGQSNVNEPNGDVSGDISSRPGILRAQGTKTNDYTLLSTEPGTALDLIPKFSSVHVGKGGVDGASTINRKESETISSGTESPRDTNSTSSSPASFPPDPKPELDSSEPLSHFTNGVKRLRIDPDEEVYQAHMSESDSSSIQDLLLDPDFLHERKGTYNAEPTPEPPLQLDAWLDERSWPWKPVGEKPAPCDLLLCRSHRETFCRLIDIYRLRVEENFVIAQEMIGKYGMPNERPPFLEFKRFLKKAAGKRILPYWWNEEKEKECRLLAMTRSEGCWIGDSVDEDDISKKYGKVEMPRWMRVYAIKIYGRKVESPLAHL
ncbi:MAG: hypothetical protein M1836_004550 [Candelina mexicana]|nr:MAG: hypothetical protein M1836_004550 [Candelina mexicana]